ncbi:bifunctional [glutamate--ammonia ligase]-adenylyl-L-tyrosine phosphorylase/[glutamate--ammonia-ligase] adenylyltransferase [Xanthomonas campestris pv. raphani]|uniref:bifunctional [glutamate--ammonia ligase]-adenylyl-L-tyrosine phosphorylase/[glutamate--ammonia-ligase] adenylyltransferase n=1 Tax=Xanthomonas campestris TaxID=339 RepID=UPI002367DE92|nr:bifunctional [glutamate--ammonia ligase]-adenylyl-L-tyrosine phosphorylase/[glutamate--ammonia-ligase] adenylyltransferase [Xanthomonas campestris]MEA9825362.1 bifunctional [glutamate--ammonia ligase]-adenylyl-L-tyrosine phosphorylase/[glutamate--ammonia-ligase] adenylyltransferase [Xanthomonas campestris pv. raphani]MEA9852776.1 bifunctional [glutamate--ammonia ligase]-adenylyl-L-tyrosine phosphorylase/[glutamate--ammonia-ligase] adenylyltransferase [Xanthomonas campestris pv. raphani]MEA985
MSQPIPSASPALAALIERAVARVRHALPADAPWPEGVEHPLARVALASDFVVDTLARQPALLAHLAQPDPPPLPVPRLDPAQPQEWAAQLRRYRAAASARLVWRDVLGLDEVDATLAGATTLAETCLQCALQALEQQFATRHGQVIAEDGSVQRLVVFGLGKLGGGELNFSSDVDLVYAYPQAGQSDGARPLAAEEYFARLGQQLAKLLDETTADGFSHRVDLRLRPFGSAGRVALSFNGMDQYFQREGRDWERYAWLKARAVAGDIAAGEAWLETLRPFVYRRYLDFTALDGLRDMKAAITAEVARHARLDDIKRGPGGIREVEFLAQSLQLIRGGREASLRERRLLPALQALVDLGQIDPPTGQALAEAYRFLRRVENRLQMLRDAQTHALPQGEPERERIALGLGYAHWQALLEALAPHRTRVAAEFAELLAPRVHATAPDTLADYWRALPEGDAAPLLGIGLHDPNNAHHMLADFAQSSGVRALSDGARTRLDRVMPALLHAAIRATQPDAALRRVLGLLQATLRRTSYLALLDEQPSALARLVDVLSRSALLAERLAAYPLLLDELLDTRIAGPLPDRAALHAACVDTLQIDDPEAALRELNERRLALSFRIALATLDGRQQAVESTRQLAWLAEAVVQTVLQLAQTQLQAAHGQVPGGAFAIIGYGSLAGMELGFGSDLDLVFLYDHPRAVEASDGARPLESGRWFARLAQKVMALLGAETGAGRLYDIDVRLRPDGGKGALVSSLASYREYQRERAWTWEHQALVRARAVAGDQALCAAFVQVRQDTLARVRDTALLLADVCKMRARMRAELDRSDAGRLDLKQGAGGLVDLEFLLQAGVLGQAAQHPALLQACDTPALIDALVQAQWLAADATQRLHGAHATLVDAGLACTLDRRPRLITPTAAIQDATRTIFDCAQAQGLAFPRGRDAPRD